MAVLSGGVTVTILRETHFCSSPRIKFCVCSITAYASNFRMCLRNRDERPTNGLQRASNRIGRSFGNYVGCNGFWRSDCPVYGSWARYGFLRVVFPIRMFQFKLPCCDRWMWRVFSPILLPRHLRQHSSALTGIIYLRSASCLISPTHVDIYCHWSTLIHGYQHLPTVRFLPTLTTLRHFTTLTNTHQHLSTVVNTYQHLPHLLTLTDTYQLLSTLINTHQHLPTLNNTYQHSTTLNNP